MRTAKEAQIERDIAYRWLDVVLTVVGKYVPTTPDEDMTPIFQAHFALRSWRLGP